MNAWMISITVMTMLRAPTQREVSRACAMRDILVMVSRAQVWLLLVHNLIRANIFCDIPVKLKLLRAAANCNYYISAFMLNKVLRTLNSFFSKLLVQNKPESLHL